MEAVIRLSKHNSLPNEQNISSRVVEKSLYRLLNPKNLVHEIASYPKVRKA